MDLNDHERAVIAAILAAVSALVSWHEMCVRLVMLRGRGRGRGNEIVMNPRSNWDGARNVALRRLYEVSEAICHSELDTMESRAEKEAPRKRKRKDPLGGMMEASVKSLALVAQSIEALQAGLNNTTAVLAGNLWAALDNTEGLTMSQKIAANCLLGENPSSARSFLALPDPTKAEAVTILLRRNGLG